MAKCAICGRGISALERKLPAPKGAGVSFV